MSFCIDEKACGNTIYLPASSANIIPFIVSSSPSVDVMVHYGATQDYIGSFSDM